MDKNSRSYWLFVTDSELARVSTNNKDTLIKVWEESVHVRLNMDSLFIVAGFFFFFLYSKVLSLTINTLYLQIQWPGKTIVVNQKIKIWQNSKDAAV